MPFNLSFDPLSMIAGIYTANRNVSMQRENNLANRELAQQQNQWSIEQWNRENAYNDPSAVLSRMKSAGLNPALMAEGNSAVIPAAQSPSMSQSRDVAPQVDPLLMANISKLNAETKSIQDDNARKNQSQPYLIKNLQAQYDNITSDTAVKDTQVGLNRAFQGKALQEANNLYQDYVQSAQRFKLDLAILQNKKSMSDEEAAQFKRNLEAQISSTEKYIHLMEAQRFHAYATARAAQSQAAAAHRQVSAQISIHNSLIPLYNAQLKECKSAARELEARADLHEIEPALRVAGDVTRLTNDIWSNSVRTYNARHPRGKLPNKPPIRPLW